LDLYHILSESGTDLRQPIGLKKQLLQEYSLDADVGQSMLQLLQVTFTLPPCIGNAAFHILETLIWLQLTFCGLQKHFK